MASYYGKYNIRVNTLIPGGVLGPKDTKYEQSKAFLKNYSKKVPLGRLANTEDIASAALFLASDASSYVTGSNFVLMVVGRQYNN